MQDCNCSEKTKDYSKPSFTVWKSNLSATIVTLKGENFQFQTLNGLYLSSSNASMSSIVLNPFTNTKSISSKFPTVSAFPLSGFNVEKIKLFPIQKFDLTERYDVVFKLPNNLLEGNYDILFFNAAGYGKASNSKNFTYFKIV